MSKPETKSWTGLPTLLMEARERRGLSRAAVADALGLRRPAIWEIENGKRHIRADELAELADLYGVSVNWLLVARAAGRETTEPS
jgi:transcriptional regulator with XRE-family HTH domain